MGNQIIPPIVVSGLLGVSLAFREFSAFTKQRHQATLLTTAPGFFYMIGRGMIPSIIAWLLLRDEVDPSIKRQTVAVMSACGSLEVVLRAIPVVGTTLNNSQRRKIVGLLTWIQRFLLQKAVADVQIRHKARIDSLLALVGDMKFPKFCRLLQTEAGSLVDHSERKLVSKVLREIHVRYHEEAATHDISQDELDHLYLKEMVYTLDDQLSEASVLFILSSISEESSRASLNPV